MSHFSYAGMCNEFLMELSSSLTKTEIDALRDNLRQAGLDKWDQWVLKNSDQISAYVSATPSQRSKKKSWQDQGLKSCLVLAGIQRVLRAKAVLLYLDDHRLQLGQSYRDMASGAGEVYMEIFAEDVPLWPFDGKNPFSENISS